MCSWITVHFSICLFYLTFLQFNNAIPYSRNTLANIFMSLDRFHIKNKCQPRDTLVKVSDLLGKKDWRPMYVSLKKCQGGHCNPKQACLPTKFKTVSIYVVRAESHDFDEPKCYDFTVKEDAACECSCKIKPNDCKANQYYDKKQCACKCKKPQKCTAAMKFDDATCKCICGNETTCTQGTKWNHSDCKCKRSKYMRYY